MSITNFIASPVLVGVVFFIAGMITQAYPPKQINSFYGYRTSSSMKNQETWDEANRYAPKMMWAIGLYSIIIGVATAFIINYWVPVSFKGGLMAGTTIASAIIPAVILMVSTERHLDKTFNKNNEIH